MQITQAPDPVSSPAPIHGMSRLNPRRYRKTGLNLVAYLVLIVISVISIFPFVWTVSTSLKGPGQIFAWPPDLIPAPIVWGNYRQVFETLPFARFFLNTIIYTVAVTVGQLLFCSLAGFSFARLRYPGRDLIFYLYLGTMMIPGSVTLVPSFILMRTFDWVNTMWAMTIPGMLGSAFGTFLMRQFMLSLPKDLDDAATIDGATKWRIYWEIILPLTKPAIAVLSLFTITSVWNDFMWPLVMLHDRELYTLTLGLASFNAGMQSYTFWSGLMAAATMTIAPLIVIFIFTQRFFTEGISLTGMGGR
jgi:multiple sugar transport system permease protein